MKMPIYLVLGAMVLLPVSAGAADKPIRFWNLTAETISELYLAPAGTSKWSPNQCLNDKDGTVETDEMLDLKDIKPGSYDIKLKDATNRICLVKNISVKAKSVISIGEKQLTDCAK